jgi:hypothetical protein
LLIETKTFIPLQEQQEQAHNIEMRVPGLADALARVAKAENDCIAANVEENDYTVFTCQDLEFELELVTQAIAKKISFIDNQVRVAQTPTRLDVLTDRRLCQGI